MVNLDDLITPRIALTKMAPETFQVFLNDFWDYQKMVTSIAQIKIIKQAMFLNPYFLEERTPW